ncbi:Calx-beta domain-containing protein [Thalassoroseus pseudoceratinae]|uniref:Calx-beta domain-containing protein n=1 Tax=Thalassoroseus pseudoceratinae TaxID=2713176 RepID=UPI00141F24DB|nr:Calx-beta domain-containing protein [Thalassoroseus pseudoceratinae]
MFLRHWLSNLVSTPRRLQQRKHHARSCSTAEVSSRRRTQRPATALVSSAETLEDRTLLSVNAIFNAGTLTVTLDAANDQAFLRVDGGNIDVGTSENGEDVLNDQAGVTNIIVQDIGAAAGQEVTFSVGDANFTQDVTITDIETASLNQDIGGTVDGNATAVNVTSPGSIQDGVDAAATGATVTVGDGTYTENVRIEDNLSLVSVNGRASTTIEGISGVGSLGAVVVTSNTTAVTIGAPMQGFTIIGIDNGNPGLENAAVYFQGSHSGATIQDNEIQANGDHGLLTEFGATIDGFVIDGNEFSGQTFVGAQPAGIGFSGQFTTANVPRQLVTIGGGSGGGNTSNITFTNNQITGVAGGISSDDNMSEQGNTLVTIDSDGVTVMGNQFAGTTTRFGSQLRARGPNTEITQNVFDGSNLGANTNQIFVQNRPNVSINENGFDDTVTAIVVGDTGGSEVVDVNDNFFGTTDPEEIDAAVFGPADLTTFLNGEDADNDPTNGFQTDVMAGVQALLTAPQGDGDNTLTVRLNGVGDSIELVLDGVVQDTIPLAGLTEINLLGADETGMGLDDESDTFIIDYTNGAIDLPVNVVGGVGASDTLEVIGGAFDSAVFNYDNANDGSIELTPSAAMAFTITYTGLEPVLIDSDFGDDVTFNLPATDDEFVLEESPDMNFDLQLRSVNGTFETTSFNAPSLTGTITVNAGDGVDDFTLGTLPAGIDDTININGEDGADILTITAQPDGPISINVDGGTPTGTPTGDTLQYTGNGMVNPTGLGSGTITEAGQETINYSDIETVQGTMTGALTILVQSTGVTGDTPTDVDNDYTRVNNAVQSAGAGSTIILEGTFDWTEMFAAEDWEAGSDGMTGTDDDYTVFLVAGRENITITANMLGDATIQGPGDLPTVNLEGVFVSNFNSPDSYAGLEISNLQIFDFDLGIGLFFGGSIDQFENTTIQNNYIRLATDTIDDTLQNIAIHFAFGENQTIQGNQIDIPGDGVSDTTTDPMNPVYASSVGMQSNTSGTVYDGLLIDGNTINVLNAQSADPEAILGIWENSNTVTGDITVSNNTFTNLDPNNDPTLNLQRAFRVTSVSNSGAGTAVIYDNNQIDGANTGFQFRFGSTGDPAQFLNNTLTQVATGFFLQDNTDSAFLQGNSMTNTGTMAGMGVGIDAHGGSVVDATGGANTISGFDIGVRLNDTAMATITNDFITGNNIGVQLTGTSTATVNENDLSGNTTFIDNQTGTPIEAELNWFGITDDVQIFAGINGPVDITPYLDGGDANMNPVDGFQADTSTLHVTSLGMQLDAMGRIEEAFDLVTGPSGEVILHNGTYDEQVTIDFPTFTDFTLRGASGDPSDVTINGLGATGIDILSPSEVTVQDLGLTLSATGLTADSITTLNLIDLLIESNTVGGDIQNVTNLNVTLSDDADGTDVNETDFSSTNLQTISYTNVANFTINGSDGTDTFDVAPTNSTTLTINGDDPDDVIPGDTLNYEGDGTVMFTDDDSGSISQAGFMDVMFNGIETVDAGNVTTDNNNITISADEDGVADMFEVRIDPMNALDVQVLVNGVVVFDQPRADVNSISLVGSNDDDTALINYEFGNPLPSGGVDFDGNGVSDDDQLLLQSNGTDVTSVEHIFTSVSSGQVVIDPGTGDPASSVTYSAIEEPILDTLTAEDRIFTFGVAEDNVTLSDDSDDSDNESLLVGPGSGLPVEFSNPTNSLTVALGGGNDNMTLEALDGLLDADVTVDGGNGQDTIDLLATTGSDTSVYELNGGTGGDTFNISPTDAVGPDITINGNEPSISPGDSLNYNGSSTLDVTGAGSGTLTPDDMMNQEVAFTGIENLNDANPPTLSIDDVTVDEDTGMATFTVSLSSQSIQTVTVDVITTDGTAQQGSDFTFASQSLSFAPGETEKTFAVTLTTDQVVELDEQFIAQLSNANGATIDDSFGTATITNDDAATFSIDDVTQDEDAGTMTFTVTLSQPVDVDVTVDYTTNPDSADSTDYTPTSGTLTFPAGQTSATITVSVTADAIVEADETFFVDLANVQASGRDVTIDDGQGVGTILNDETATLSIDDVSADEAAGTMTFTVSLSQTVDTDVTFDFTTTPDTADANDYTPTSGSITIPEGETSATITVTITDDMIVEGTEQFFVDLSNLQASGRDVTIDDGQGTGTITDNDSATVSIDDVTQDEDAGSMTFTVSLTQPVSSDVTVDFTTTPDSADASDYTPTSGSVTIPDGQTSATIVVAITADMTVEDDEQFFVDLSNLQASGQSVSLSDSQGIGTIVNDDIATGSGQIVDQPIANPFINGNFQFAVSGNFDGVGGPEDDLLFWDPISGQNRIVFGDGTQQNNPVAPLAINNDYSQIVVGNFDEGGGTDLFLWNPATGQNRVIHLNGPTGNVVGTVETNVVSNLAINGNDFETVVVGDFNGLGPDDLFFYQPGSGRNRLIHLETATPGSDTDVNNVQNSAINPETINGEYESVYVGQFVAGGLDELLFIDLASGSNRIVTLTPTTPGQASDTADVQTNSLPPLAFNGSEYNRIAIGDIDGNGIDDVFAWDHDGGINRVALLDTAPSTPPQIVDNLVAPLAINGEYDEIVRLRDDVFADADGDEFFFWDPTNGRNRGAYV